ncbi:DEAD/DEAH box helicase [Paenibacillus chartarius]|uniref:DEAD/DEAH box helicase n=1 Tax=Paenibacillus chartarius TaxID=747481 RepID=A0ABV6DEU3_9BACL
MSYDEEQQSARSRGKSYTSLLYPHGETPVDDEGLVRGILGLFGSGRSSRSTAGRYIADTRTTLAVEFTLSPIAAGSRRTMLGIDMKIGPKRLYIVQKLREFLRAVERGQAFPITKGFVYDPAKHVLLPEDHAVVRKLIDLMNHEEWYYDSVNLSNGGMARTAGDRTLTVPPDAWEELIPLAAQSQHALLEHGGAAYPTFLVADEPLPLEFRLDELPEEGCRLTVRGLEQMTVLEAYGLALSGHRLFRMEPEQARQLAELKQLLERADQQHVEILSGQLDAFVEKAIPGLMKLGNVRIAQAVTDRIVVLPLKARLYLDRVKDRLLAGLEFQYGDIVIDPLNTEHSRRGERRILMRDGDREGRIMELLERGGFVQTAGGFFIDDEETEYGFLYHIVPELEKLVDIYATSAVKARLVTDLKPPRVTVNVDERVDWLEIRFDMSGIPQSVIRDIVSSLEVKRQYYRMPEGALLPLESAEFQDLVRLLNELGVRKGDLNANMELRVPAVRGLRLLESEPSYGSSVKIGKSLRELLEHLRHPERLDFPVPASLESVLRDYQKFGYGWMKALAHYGFGGVLADDMGLGKTLQSIAYLVSELQDIRDRGEPALIVAPASLTYNWLNELRRFAPEVRAVVADGERQERSHKLTREAIGQADVIITSYPLLRIDAELYAGRMFHTFILDEAQAFKNASTQTAQAVKVIQARQRFALTGTPMENRLEELWSIYAVVFPELFPNRKRFGELSQEEVARRIRPFLLRRLKRDVLKELPEKIESMAACELLPEQKQLYAAHLAKLQHDAYKHLNEDDFGFQKNRIKILAGLTRLRQLICHPALFVEGYTGSSAKFELLFELVEECRAAGRRLLVFSQFTEMLDLIGRELAYRGVSHFYLDGHTPAAERVQLCSRFNEGERELFLISLKAGGTGLNLTGADTVVLYDLWWNPAVELQAMDRAHRIGQKNVVQVIRLIAQGTIEDKMYELQQRKRRLIDDVIQPGEEALSGLTEQELREILTI